MEAGKGYLEMKMTSSYLDIGTEEEEEHGEQRRQ
jgi:hypothetical protein